LQWLHQAKAQGVFEAVKLLQDITQENRVEVVRKTHEEATRGNADAQYRLGRYYSYGIEVAEDGAEAVRWFRKAAEMGHAEAQCELAAHYHIGFGVIGIAKPPSRELPKRSFVLVPIISLVSAFPKTE
jgi:hypothetical protein